ncbi:transposase [Paludibacter sp. 221]|uniref:phage integrase SAM-like domain-containing protein n=1 Tax=Paludibacter sp. 221 TaxID=2302939 RepID=UPI0013D09DA2|nr:phage integrase SAM-like domain-containing protein [Paludibacter sp. 221]NDV46238.1 transposase [Paludibacter sp. 221]
MISFKPAIRRIKTDGYAAVYIRVVKKREIGYIKTQYIVSPKQHNRTEITDYSVIAKIYLLIGEYSDKVNSFDIKKLTVSEIIERLTSDTEEISFIDFYDKYVLSMIKDDRIRPAANYKSAINSLKKYTGKENLYFSDITSKVINSWINTELKNKKRAKSMYPSCIEAVFKAGLMEYNDYDRGIIRIKNQPFMLVKIPKQTPSEKKAIDKDDLTKLFDVDISKAKNRVTTPMAKDVALLIFCLAGINTVDLYHAEKHELIDGKLCYRRRKTKDRRSDGAYIEIKVPEIIHPLLNKYKGEHRLFSFSEMYNTESNFNKYLNEGLQELSALAEIEKTTSYTFRHSWATIARNDCRASESDVAFALNHSSEHRITRGYIKTDFTPIDRLNEKVIEYVFNEENKALK